jgi:hypothetical protein
VLIPVAVFDRWLAETGQRPRLGALNWTPMSDPGHAARGGRTGKYIEGHRCVRAQHAGLAPVPHWSGRTAGRMRRPKYGNRQLNSAVHRIAVTQLRLDGPGRDRFTHDVERVTGQPPQTVEQYIGSHPELFA